MWYFATSPLQLEILRWKGVPADRRFCVLCKDKVEDKGHFLFDCPNYTELRRDFNNTIFTNEEDIEKLSTKEKFIIMMQKENINVFSQYAHHRLNKRQRSVIFLTARLAALEVADRALLNRCYHPPIGVGWMI